MYTIGQKQGVKTVEMGFADTEKGKICAWSAGCQGVNTANSSGDAKNAGQDSACMEETNTFAKIVAQDIVNTNGEKTCVKNVELVSAYT